MITPARNPKQCGGEANESEATVAMEQYQAGHCRNCSNANLFWHKKQRYVYSSGPHTRTSYQDTEEKCKRSSMKDLLHRGSQKIFIQLPRGIPEELSDKHQCIASSWGGSRQDLHKIFSQGPVRDHARTSDRISSGSSQHLLTRTPQDLGQDLHLLRTPKTAQWTLARSS